MAGGIDLGNAYVQIIPSAKGISGLISKELDGESTSAGTKSGENIAAALVGTLKKALVAAGIGKLIQAAMDEGGKLQQSYGGLDTIYGDASKAAKDYAAQAVMAGISANDYAEQAVSFGASLRQAFGGDTAKAVESANTAILDMTDNAAKMGTPLESLKVAYQGFSKQNYTMLDNLKLGYGGTKKEMERLLADATKLSGVKYDISNLGDVYEAIHVIQQDLGLTGVAAAEAAGTFTGSMGAMMAATKNFLGNLALGEDIETPLRIMMNSIQNFFVGNVLPMLKNIFTGIPTILSLAVTEGIPLLLQTAQTLFTEIQTLLPQASMDTVNGFVSGIMAQAPELIAAGAEIVSNLISGIGDSLPGIIDQGAEALNGFLDNFLAGVPGILDAGTEAIKQLSAGIQAALPGIVQSAGNAIASFLQTVFNHLPEIVDSGLKMIQALSQGLWANFQVLAQSAGDAVLTIAGTILDNLPTILECGVELIGAIIAGMLTRIPHVLETLDALVIDMVNKFISYDWGALGLRIIQGIIDGLKKGGRLLVDAAQEAAKSAFDSACNFLGIKSPSRLFRDEVGAMMAEGMAIGFEENVPTAEIQRALAPMASVVPDAAAGSAYNYGGFSINVYQQPGQSSEALVDMIETRINQRIRSRQAVFA